MGRHVSVILQQNESYMIDPAKVKNLRFEITYSWEAKCPRIQLDAGWILSSGNFAYASRMFNNKENYDYRYYRYEESLAFLNHGTETFDSERRGESSFQLFLNIIPDQVDSIFFSLWYVLVTL